MKRWQYLLLKLSEECSEVSHRASKAMRFGMDEVQSGQTDNNGDRIIGELRDLTTVVTLLMREGILPNTIIAPNAADFERVEKYYQYSKARGLVE